eukprot:2765923-Amphidinium_carterae.2
MGAFSCCINSSWSLGYSVAAEASVGNTYSVDSFVGSKQKIAFDRKHSEVPSCDFLHVNTLPGKLASIPEPHCYCILILSNSKPLVSCGLLLSPAPSVSEPWFHVSSMQPGTFMQKANFASGSCHELIKLASTDHKKSKSAPSLTRNTESTPRDGEAQSRSFILPLSKATLIGHKCELAVMCIPLVWGGSFYKGRICNHRDGCAASGLLTNQGHAQHLGVEVQRPLWVLVMQLRCNAKPGIHVRRMSHWMLIEVPSNQALESPLEPRAGGGHLLRFAPLELPHQIKSLAPFCGSRETT